MIRKYNDFVKKYLWKRIDFDGAYGYQCVDLIKLYMKECLGMKVPLTIGNAKEIGKNKYKIFDKTWASSKNMDNLMQGDILVRTKWTLGHITIFDRFVNGKVIVLEQNGQWDNPKTKVDESGNWLWANVIRKKEYNPDFFDVVWRWIRIMDNYADEIQYCKNKIAEYWSDAETLDYMRSIRII